jgi:manganese-transporting P-type ATPase
LKEVSPETRHVLAAAHALVRLDDGIIVGDPMEKTTLEALGWQLKSSDNVRPIPLSDDAASAVVAHKASLHIRRRFQFSSALKRMSTVSTLQSGKTLACVKGAPETIKTMMHTVPGWYDETFKHYTRRGSRVLALAFKEMHGMNFDKVHLSDGSPSSESAHIHM